MKQREAAPLASLRFPSFLRETKQGTSALPVPCGNPNGKSQSTSYGANDEANARPEFKLKWEKPYSVIIMFASCAGLNVSID
jgi:hypothetical protein